MITAPRAAAIPAILVLLAAFGLLLWRPWAAAPRAQGPMRLYFLNVGQGDGALLVTPDGVTALVDGGEASRGPSLVAWLRSMGFQRVDWIMPSHPHADHIGGLNTVLEEMPVGAALVSGQTNTSATYRRQMALLQEKGVPVTPAKEGTVLNLGAAGVTATVLNPPEELLRTQEPEEDNSVVMRVCLDGSCILFTGDIGDQGERMLIQRYRDRPDAIRSAVLKVSHHGSAEPNNPALLELIRPEVALIGTGAGNPFGHPTQRALDRLAASGAAVHCTEVEGTILVEIDATGYRLSSLPDVAIAAAGRGAPPLLPPPCSAPSR